MTENRQQFVRVCDCGCGEPTLLAQITHRKHGRRKGQPQAYVNGHNGRRSPVDWIEEDRGYSTPCWIWQLAMDNRGGYGKCNRDGIRAAHRWTYTTLVGPIPDGLHLDHLCRVRCCVNPDHLEPVTNAENIRRGIYGSRTHCKHGHEFTPENTRIAKNGGRVCIECERWAKRKRRHLARTGEVLPLRVSEQISRDLGLAA